MKKMLVITPRFPFPVIGGDKLRIYNICKALSQQFDLTLLTFFESKEELSFEISESLFNDVHKIYLPKWKSYLNSIFAYIFNKPMQVGYYSSKEMRKHINRLLPENDFVLAHLIRTGHYLKNMPTKCKKILEMTDAISLNYERVKNLQNKNTNLKTIIYSIESERLKKYEQEILQHFDLITLVSQIDKEFLMGSKQNTNVKVISNGVDIYKFGTIDVSFGNDVIFIGNMRTEQNLDACRFFSRDILPRIRSYCPNIRFKIIGPMKNKEKKEFSKYDGVDVTGLVNDIFEASKNGFAAVCPLRLGAGIQNKILEYMALGIPTITTSMGLEGINAIVNTEIIVADTVEDFTNAVLKLHFDRKLGYQIGNAGHLYVKNNHDWSHLLNNFINAINKI